MCPGSPITQISTPVETLTRKAGSFCLCWFERWWEICGPSICLGSPITQISTPVETLTRKAGSFCLCCFSQVMRHLWSLHMSGIPRHTYLHPDRNFYPTSRFILSVLSLHMSGIPHHMDLQSGRNVYQTSWFIQSVFVLTGSEMSHRPPPW